MELCPPSKAERVISSQPKISPPKSNFFVLRETKATRWRGRKALILNNIIATFFKKRKRQNQLLKLAVVIESKVSIAKNGISEYCYLASNHIQVRTL